MLRLDAFVPADRAVAVFDALVSLPGVRHVVAGAPTSEGLVSVSAEVDAVAADLAIDVLSGFGLGGHDVTLWRVPGVRPLGWRDGRRAAGADAQVWAEVVGRAHEHSEIVATYLMYMVAAGVIAGVGVLTGSSILVVGAMALSPDLLPISATAIGLVERRWQLAARALRALTVGLGTAAVAALGATALLRASGRIHEDLVLAETVLGPSLTTLGPGSMLVAVAAGMAGMLAFERPGGAAVGVAISVTTIPAAAYVGAAIALGKNEPMWGALVVLVANVVLIVSASTVTLWFQQYRRRRSVPAAASTSDGGRGRT